MKDCLPYSVAVAAAAASEQRCQLAGRQLLFDSRCVHHQNYQKFERLTSLWNGASVRTHEKILAFLFCWLTEETWSRHGRHGGNRAASRKQQTLAAQNPTKSTVTPIYPSNPTITKASQLWSRSWNSFSSFSWRSAAAVPFLRPPHPRGQQRQAQPQPQRLCPWVCLMALWKPFPTKRFVLSQLACYCVRGLDPSSFIYCWHQISISFSHPIHPSFQFSIFAPIIFYYRQYSAPPEGVKATARHILCKKKDDAVMVLEKLQAGGGVSFASFASEYSSCPSKNQGGSLGSFRPGTMVPEFDEVIFNPETKLNQVVGPVMTPVRKSIAWFRIGCICLLADGCSFV